MALGTAMATMGSAASAGMAAMGTASGLATASTAMSGLSAVTGYIGAQKQARMTNAAYTANANSSLTAYQNDIEATNLNAMASDEASTQRRLEATREGLAARGSARAAAGERGVGGYSVAAIERDLGFQTGSRIAAVNRNQELDAQRRRLSGRGARDAAQSRINSAPRDRGPSLLALGTELGASAVNGLTMRSQLQAFQRQGTG